MRFRAVGKIQAYTTSINGSVQYNINPLTRKRLRITRKTTPLAINQNALLGFLFFFVIIYHWIVESSKITSKNIIFNIIC